MATLKPSLLATSRLSPPGAKSKGLSSEGEAEPEFLSVEDP